MQGPAGAPPSSSIQKGIITTLANFEYSSHLTIYLKNNFDAEQIKKRVSSISKIIDEVSIVAGFACDQKLQTVVGFSKNIWQLLTLDDHNLPQELVEFKEKVSKFSAQIGFPATGGDIFFYSKAISQDLNVIARQIFLRGIGEDNISKLDHTTGFKYLGGKDLTGFIDGTRNAPLEFIIIDAAIIHPGDEDSDSNAGGSYLLTSRFVHNLKKFESLSIAEKSKVIGRDLSTVIDSSNPKLPDAMDHLKNPASYPSSPSSNYHINRGFGAMYRQGWPYSTLDESGLYFMGFSRSLRELDAALNRMIGLGTNDETQIDNLLHFSTAVTTNYYYCPSVTQLQKLA
jgi:putative iron-dependent peroxidase